MSVEQVTIATESCQLTRLPTIPNYLPDITLIGSCPACNSKATLATNEPPRDRGYDNDLFLFIQCTRDDCQLRTPNHYKALFKPGKDGEMKRAYEFSLSRWNRSKKDEGIKIPDMEMINGGK